MAKPDTTELSIVIPTFKEADNVAEIVRRLGDTLTDIGWEIIFVDDASPDGTADVVRKIARTEPRVRVISRHNRRGLASAVVEGALAASADIIAVMDGDLQHDETVLPGMYEIVREDEADVVSASRFLREDGADGLSSETRVAISNTGIKLANTLFGMKMTDPLTGFFVIKRDFVTQALPDLSELGFKILMDLIISSEPRPRIKEVPFKFRERVHGESKLDNRVMYEFFLFFIEKKVSSIIPLPARFISFAMVNATGILVHLAVLIPLMSFTDSKFWTAQLIATFVAMAFNYTVNNLVTYSDKQLKGPKFYAGFLIFCAFCSVGVWANVGVATILNDGRDGLYYLIAALGGALLSVVWNYVATGAFVWGRTKYPKFLRGIFGAKKTKPAQA